MQQIASYASEWICCCGCKHREGLANKALTTILGIIKDSLMMSVVVMMGAALTLLLG